MFALMLAQSDIAPWLLIPVIIVLAMIPTVFWIWSIVECVTKEPSEGNDKVVWLLIIIFLGCLGTLLYWLIRRPERIRQYGA